MKRFLVQTAVTICGLWCFSTLSFSQAAPSDSASESSTSTDLFIMLGSDFVRPGLGTRANYNIGLGHTYGFLKKDPLGDEVTFAYVRKRRIAWILPHVIWFSYRSAGHHEELCTSADQESDGLYVDSAWSHEHDRKRICSESSLRRRVGRIDRSFQRSSFDLDSGNIQ